MRSSWVMAGIAVLAMVSCSGGDSGTEPVNNAPTITFTTTASAVEKNAAIDLSVSVSDLDGDALTITWQITRGSLVAQNSARTVMRWSTPATTGEDTVRIRVSDGTATRSITEPIKVGTLFVPSFATGTFLKANSPYILRPSATDPKVTVPANGSLLIEPGTEVLMDTPAGYISVLGNLEAHGSETEPIVIRANRRNLNCGADRGWWDGISAASDDAQGSHGFVDLEHVDIWHARWGVRLRDNAGALLRDCRVRCSRDAGMLIEGNGALRAFDSRFSDALSDGIAIAALTSLPDSVRIQGCELVLNGNAGIRMDLDDRLQVVPITVELNQIEFNRAHGISLTRAVFPSIHYNAFRGNGDTSVSNLFLSSYYPDPVVQPTLDATCNYWGSAASSQSTIDASIRDSLDTSLVHSRVTSCPWLNENPVTTTPPPLCDMVCP